MQNNGAVEKTTKQLNRKTLLKILDNSYDAIFATDGNGIFYANKACETYIILSKPRMEQMGGRREYAEQ